MRKYSIPCIISLLVAALYNIVDQIFIANADNLGSYGNATVNVTPPIGPFSPFGNSGGVPFLPSLLQYIYG